VPELGLDQQEPDGLGGNDALQALTTDRHCQSDEPYRAGENCKRKTDQQTRVQLVSIRVQSRRVGFPSSESRLGN
jgi:hypothetical protein